MSATGCLQAWHTRPVCFGADGPLISRLRTVTRLSEAGTFRVFACVEVDSVSFRYFCVVGAIGQVINLRASIPDDAAIEDSRRNGFATRMSKVPRRDRIRHAPQTTPCATGFD